MASLKTSLAAAAALALAFTAACGKDNGNGNPPDAGSTAYGLAIVGGAVLTLHPGDVRNLQVVLGQNEVGPVPNAEIQFAFDDGDPAGAALTVLDTQTGTDGTASTKLTVGANSQFKIVATAPGYPEVRPVAFSINVVPVRRLLQIVGGPNVRVATDGESAGVTMYISSSVGLKARLLDQDTGQAIAGEDVVFSLPTTPPVPLTFSGTSPKTATAKTGADGAAQVFALSSTTTISGVIATAQVASGGVNSVTFSVTVQSNSSGSTCTVNSQCPAGQICSAGICTTQTGSGSCTPGNDQQCPFGYECIGGVCTPPANTNCDINNPNCPAGQYCSCTSDPAPICSCTPICPTCAVGTTCNPTTHTCDPNPPPRPDVTGVWYTKHSFSIKDALGSWFGTVTEIIRVIDQLLRGQFFTGALSFLNAILKAIVDQYIPAWVQTVVKILDAIGTILSYLRSDGSMNLRPNGGSDFQTVKGSEVWTALVFYWLPLCGDISGDPTIPPDCARFDVATTDADNPTDVGQCKGQSIPAVSVQVEPFMAHVSGTDPTFQFDVDQRKVQLKMGKVLLIVINLLISYLTEYQCIDEALDCAPGNQCLIDCAAIAQTLSNATGGWVPASVIEGICYPLVTTAGKAITSLLAGVTFETDVLDFNGHSSIDKKDLRGQLDNTTCLTQTNCANQLGKADFDYKLQKDVTHRDGWWEGAFFMKTIKNMPGAFRSTRELAP